MSFFIYTYNDIHYIVFVKVVLWFPRKQYALRQEIHGECQTTSNSEFRYKQVNSNTSQSDFFHQFAYQKYWSELLNVFFIPFDYVLLWVRKSQYEHWPKDVAKTVPNTLPQLDPIKQDGILSQTLTWLRLVLHTSWLIQINLSAGFHHCHGM